MTSSALTGLVATTLFADKDEWNVRRERGNPRGTILLSIANEETTMLVITTGLFMYDYPGLSRMSIVQHLTGLVQVCSIRLHLLALLY